MNKISKISICATLVVCMIVSMCPASYAVDYSTDTDIYSVDCSRPAVDINHAYIEVLQRVYVEEWQDYGYFATVYTFSSQAYFDTNLDVSTDAVEPWMRVKVQKNGTLTFYCVGDTDIYYVASLAEYRSSSSAYYADSNHETVSFSIPTGYEIVSFHAYGFSSVNTDLTSFSEFTILYDDEATTYHKLSELYLLISSFEYYIDLDTAYLNSIMNSSSSIVSKFEDLLSYYYQILPLLNNIDTNVSEILSYQSAIESLLDSILFYVDDIQLVCWFINSELQLVNENILKILDALNLEGESDLTSPDTSNNDKYYDMEHSLLDNSGVDVNDAVKVEIDQNALVVIWDMVENIFDTHPQVFGLVITFLSLSIIALILGRGKR